ncbi:hypothetical protein ACO0LO_19550 [Undibacterium sp. TJN25]|uniref:hypothetical protein n=1 Tax=Undibacterium sp. TJN25 TaxID=3413056 RepID=UPI003BF044A6
MQLGIRNYFVYMSFPPTEVVDFDKLNAVFFKHAFRSSVRVGKELYELPVGVYRISSEEMSIAEVLQLVTRCVEGIVKSMEILVVEGLKFQGMGLKAIARKSINLAI